MDVVVFFGMPETRLLQGTLSCLQTTTAKTTAIRMVKAPRTVPNHLPFLSTKLRTQTTRAKAKLHPHREESVSLTEGKERTAESPPAQLLLEEGS